MTELAWDAHGNYVGEDVPHPIDAPALDVQHGNGCHDHDPLDRECGTFICNRCRRAVPFCFGGDDDSLCNDCWSAFDTDSKEHA